MCAHSPPAGFAAVTSFQYAPAMPLARTSTIDIYNSSLRCQLSVAMSRFAPRTFVACFNEFVDLASFPAGLSVADPLACLARVSLEGHTSSPVRV